MDKKTHNTSYDSKSEKINHYINVLNLKSTVNFNLNSIESIKQLKHMRTSFPLGWYPSEPTYKIRGSLI